MKHHGNVLQLTLNFSQVQSKNMQWGKLYLIMLAMFTEYLYTKLYNPNNKRAIKDLLIFQ